jgi:hypothetical protein
LVEAGDRALVHLFVRAVAAVDAHDRRLGAVALGVGAWSAESLGPVGGQALAVAGVEAVAEGVADDLVGHHPGVPRLGQAEPALVASGGVVHALHGRIIT